MAEEVFARAGRELQVLRLIADGLGNADPAYGVAALATALNPYRQEARSVRRTDPCSGPGEHAGNRPGKQ